MKKALFIDSYSEERYLSDVKPTCTLAQVAAMLQNLAADPDLDPNMPVYIRGLWDICGERYDAITGWSFTVEEFI